MTKQERYERAKNLASQIRREAEALEEMVDEYHYAVGISPANIEKLVSILTALNDVTFFDWNEKEKV